MQADTPTAIVTGSAGGIGEATARALAKRGFRIAIADLRLDAAKDTATLMQTEGFAAEAVLLDVASPDSAAAMVEKVLSLYGRIDVLVNNAGIESSLPFLELSLEEYERVMRVNTTGVWICCRAVIPIMLRQAKGAIVNVSSVAAQRGGGLLGTAAYATSKGATIALTKALALRLFLLSKKASKFNHDTLGGLTDQGPRGSPWGYYLDGPWDVPRSVEGRETRWRGLQAIPDQLSRFTMKARFCNRTRTLLL